TIYVGTSDGRVQVSRDAGVTWTLSTAGLPLRAVTRIVVDPTNAQHALITFSGFNSGHVFETLNAGASWRDISAGLVNAPANVAVLLGTSIVVGTDVGAFVTSDDGATWAPGPSGLPNVIVQDLVYSSTLGKPE